MKNAAPGGIILKLAKEAPVRKLFMVAAVLIGITSFSYAGTKEDIAKEVVKLTDIRKVTDQVSTQVLQLQAEKMKSVNIPKERQAEESAVREKIRNKLLDALRWEKLEVDYAKFLAETYSEDELKAILAFCQSPAGQSILKKEPVIMGKIMVMMQERVQSVFPEIQKMTRDFTESVKKVK